MTARIMQKNFTARLKANPTPETGDYPSNELQIQ